MLASAKPEPDFSRRCAGGIVSYLLFATYPAASRPRERFGNVRHGSLHSADSEDGADNADTLTNGKG
jgi:hypothetical protein